MLSDRASQMVVFAALLTHKNFTQAAKSLGVSVSHVSKQLALLEESLGVKLVPVSYTHLRAHETN